MLHSTITKKGQTTIPGEVRLALKIQPGDRLEYQVQGDHVTIRVHPGIRSLAGVLAGDKSKGLSFNEIRRQAAVLAQQKASP